MATLTEKNAYNCTDATLNLWSKLNFKTDKAQKFEKFEISIQNFEVKLN